LNETRDRILDSMQELIQTMGFNAVSYQDISEALGIRKASIHYHFPSKSDLGRAVVDRYQARLAGLMEKAENEPGRSHGDVLSDYFKPFIQVAGSADKVCLCGALAGEFLSLPPDMREAVSSFFRQHENWLENLLEKGRSAGEFRFDASARDLSRLIFSALQGGLILRRSKGDADQLDNIILLVRAMLRP
jgi:TetR/AcrR family transcriptional repressor of nem operon